MEKDFYTFRGYMNRDGRLTASMEDYLEMLYRLATEKGYTRIRELSSALNVQPPAATRMVQRMATLKLVKYQKYGMLELDELGKQIGESLLERHRIVEVFLREIGVEDEEILEETEKIEHTISFNTIRCITDFVEFMENNVAFQDAYRLYRKNKSQK